MCKLEERNGLLGLNHVVPEDAKSAEELETDKGQQRLSSFRPEAKMQWQPVPDVILYEP